MISATSNTLAILGGRPAVGADLVTPWPVITDDDRAAIARALDAGVLWGHDAPEVAALEREWAAKVGSRYCLATNNGTAALHLALAGIGIEPGDEVITSAVSWTSTATSILFHNAIPVFADVDPETGNIDVGDIERNVSPRTKALLPVHLHGLPADMTAIRTIAADHNLIVIEDACQAHGALVDGAVVGSLGDAAAFSVHASKNLPGLGEGGLFVTDDEEIFERAASVHQFGEVRQSDGSRDFESVAVGWNYRSFEVPAAFVRSQLTRFEATLQTVRHNAALLSEALGSLAGLHVPATPADRTGSYWAYTVALYPEELGISLAPERFRDLVRSALIAEGVSLHHSDLVLPAMSNFQGKIGYGRGSPWTDGHATPGISYALDQYPAATDRVARTISLDGHRPPNGSDAVDAYGRAFEKVWSSIDQLIDSADAIEPARVFGTPLNKTLLGGS